MKNMKQFITTALVTLSVAYANGQTGLPAAPPPEDPLSVGGGGFGGASVGRTPRAVTSTANVYAQNGASDYGTVYGYSSRSSGSSVPPVVIQFGSKNADAIATMEEDLAIMTLIIDRALERLGQDVPDEKMGIKLYYTSGGKSVRALYLENFGPLFLVKVNFPVHAPVVVEAKEPEKADESEWNEVRRKLRGEPEEMRWTGSSSGVPYEAERVEELKKQLIAALRNASNMKGVKADEHVTVTVFGAPAAAGGSDWRKWSEKPDSSPQPRAGGGRGGAQTSANRFATGVVEMNKDSVRTSLQGTVLTLRIKKSDIDAAGKEGADALAKKAMVNTYAGNGHGLSSVNSWIRSSSSSSLQVR